jgi:hypothetical protein
MKVMNGVSKNRHGVYYVRKKVPKQLEQATAEALSNGKSRQVFLKRSPRGRSGPRGTMLDHCAWPTENLHADPRQRSSQEPVLQYCTDQQSRGLHRGGQAAAR